MNEEIKKIFKKYSVKEIGHQHSSDAFTQLSIQIQGDQRQSLVFYRITEAAGAKERFLERAAKTNASAIVINRPCEVPPEYKGNVFLSSDQNWIELQNALCDHFYPRVSGQKLIGITGTNGKTTTVNLVRDMLWESGVATCSVGTIGIQGRDGVVKEDLSITTPSFIDIRRVLWQYREEFTTFVFEVSSHALDQDRFHHLTFESAAWTNLTQDHLDYHKTFEAYGAAKAKLAKISDEFFVLENHSEVCRTLEKLKIHYKKLEIESRPEDCPPFFKLAHNWENYLLAKACAGSLLGHKITTNWGSLHPPRGRFETIEWNERLIVIDYAHTPDALAKILESTKMSFPKRNLICIFGAGGDRDPTKRPIMGKVASEYADQLIITSDNPRSEEPQLIIDQIVAGIVLKAKIGHALADRKEAIEKCLSDSTEGDIIVIAGKGHETYQDVKGVKHPFDDKKVVLDFIQSHPGAL